MIERVAHAYGEVIKTEGEEGGSMRMWRMRNEEGIESERYDNGDLQIQEMEKKITDGLRV